MKKLLIPLLITTLCGSPQLFAYYSGGYPFDTNKPAPIIECGKQIGLLTNPMGTLATNITTTALYEATLTTNGFVGTVFSMNIRTPGQKVQIFKIEDGWATIVSYKDGYIEPKVEVQASSIKELSNVVTSLPITNATWIGTEQTLKEVDKELTPFDQLPHDSYHTSPDGKYKQIKWEQSLKRYYTEDPNEWGDLQVPIYHEQPAGDNSSITALANALNYLFTKANGKPTTISKAFLFWAYDSYPLETTAIQTNKWKPQEYIKQYSLEEGECNLADKTFNQTFPIEWIRDGDSQPKQYSGITTNVNWMTQIPHPHQINLPIESRDEHQIELERALKAICQFGICEDKNMPTKAYFKGQYTPPTPDILKLAQTNLKNHELIIKCFQAWKAPQEHYLPEYFRSKLFWGLKEKDMIKEREKIKDATYYYIAQYYQFIQKEVSSGHPVIITYTLPQQLDHITNPIIGKAIKKSFVVIACPSNELSPAFTFLTPDGKQETYDLFGDHTKSYPSKEIPTRGVSAALDNNEPFQRKDIKQPQPIPGFKPGSNIYNSQIAIPKFECYSIGIK